MRVNTCGYETVPTTVATEFSFSFEGTVTGNVTRDGTKVRSGAFSRKYDTGAGNAVAYTFHTWVNNDGSTAVGVGWYWRCYFLWESLPSSSTNMFLRFGSSTAATLCAARLTTAGKIRLINPSGTQIGSDSAETVALEDWYLVELYGKVGTGATDEASLWLNEELVASVTGQTWDENGIDRGYVGWSQVPGANRVVYSDDMALNSSEGSTHTERPGPGKVIYLDAISDNALSGSWTAGAGATTNLFEAVNNDPPVGVAAGSETDTSQIENTNASDATGNYDANMETYADAGLLPSDSIRLIQPIANHARVTTNVNAAMQVLSNPTGPEQTGFVWGRGANAGTFPTSWNCRWGNVIDNPTVDINASPVVRVGRRQAVTATVFICGLRLAVEYNPGKQTGYFYRRRSMGRR